MEDKLIVTSLQNELPIGELKVDSFEELKEKWAIYFNGLVRDDFSKLVRLFYRIDVSENTLRRLLKENPDVDAGKIITSLVIERLLQKIKSRAEFPSMPDEDSRYPDAEIW